MLPGQATPEGTRRYRDAAAAAPGHFRAALSGLQISSLGIGTYLGRDDAATDALYAASVRRALHLGINVIDTAINYRNQRSERAVGAALRESGVPRDQVVLCTKGGYLPFDGARPHDVRRYIEDTFVRPGLLEPGEIVAGCHSLAPRFIADQIDRSRRNLGVARIDVYYLHNPETQLGEVPRAQFLRRLRDAFAELERASEEGRIAAYGAATWNGFLLPPGDEEHLSLAEALAAAREVAGERHRFRALQLPFNLEMDEAARLETQGDLTVLEAARQHGLTVFASASILQGRLAHAGPRPVRESAPGLRTVAQRALQSARSAPGIACALVGMKTPAHVEENAELVRIPPLQG